MLVGEALVKRRRPRGRRPRDDGSDGADDRASTADGAGDADEHGWFGGHFGGWGGRFMPEALVAALDELTVAWQEAMADPAFTGRVRHDPARVRRRAEPALRGRRGSPSRSAARILLKREDLNHTGAHKIRNVLGQALLTKRMGKTRVIAETGAGQHGVASATAAAYFGLDCTVYMGAVDTKRQALNVARMQLLGAEGGPGRLRQRAPSRTPSTRRCATGSPASTTRPTSSAPPPARTRSRAWSATSPAASATRRGPSASSGTACCRDAVAACVGGGSNAIGLFTAFLDDATCEIYGFEAGGDGVDTGRHAATITAGDAGRAARRPHLRAPGRGRPDHRVALDLGRASTTRASARSTPTSRRPAGRRTRPVTDAEAMDAMALLSRTEGIIPAIESAHAIAGALQVGRGATARTTSCWSTSPAAATRTWAPRSSGSASATPRAADGATSRVAMSTVAPPFDEGPRRRARGPGRLPPGRLPRRRRRASRRCAPWSTPAAT